MLILVFLSSLFHFLYSFLGHTYAYLVDTHTHTHALAEFIWGYVCLPYEVWTPLIFPPKIRLQRTSARSNTCKHLRTVCKAWDLGAAAVPRQFSAFLWVPSTADPSHAQTTRSSFPSHPSLPPNVQEFDLLPSHTSSSSSSIRFCLKCHRLPPLCMVNTKEPSSFIFLPCCWH